MNEGEDKSVTEKSMDELEGEAARLRSRLSEDVQALKNKMAPDNVKQQAKQALVHKGQRATARLKDMPWDVAGLMIRGVSELVRTARARPFAASAAGVGIVLVGWFAISRRRRHSY